MDVMTRQLIIHSRTSRAGPVIELVGELDNQTASDVHALLPDLTLQPGQQFAVDLAELTFCDSSGIAVLMAARHYADQAHATLVLTAVPERVLRILRRVGLEHAFTIYAHEWSQGAT